MIFAFVGNVIFAGIYYSTQRLLKARMFSDVLSQLHFWGWQAIIVAAAITLPLGITQGKEYAELEWPIDIAIAVVWVALRGQLLRDDRQAPRAAPLRRDLVLHRDDRHRRDPAHRQQPGVCRSRCSRATRLRRRAGRVHAVVVRAQRGRVLPDHAVPRPDVLLPAEGGGAPGLLLPAVDHPLLVAGLHLHLGRPAPPALHRAAGVGLARSGMLFSVMLWMPSWGGMINGLLTLRGAWNKVSEDPVLKFFVVGITFYGMATFEGPLLSIKSVNALSHYTDWTIAHVHGGALGWNGFMAFGMMYWLAPRLFQTKLWSQEAGRASLLARHDRHPALHRGRSTRRASRRA